MTYNGEVLADAPLAYYRLGEPSGTTMVDSSGNARNGTYSNSGGATLGLGTAGLVAGDTCADFRGGTSGVGSRGTVTYASWMALTTMTLEAIINADTTTGIIAGRVNNSAAFGNQYVQYLFYGSGLVACRCFYDNGASFAFCDTPISTGTTYHVAMTVSLEDGRYWLRLWVNGGLKGEDVLPVGSVPSSGSTSIGFTVGASSGSAAGYAGADGRIDEVAIYGAALTRSRITAHVTAAGITISPDTTGTARVSREHVETLVNVVPDVRVSREVVETLVAVTNDARVSREVVEVLWAIPPAASASWWDGSVRKSARLRGWWDGSTIQPVIVRGWWDGSTIRPLS